MHLDSLVEIGVGSSGSVRLKSAMGIDRKRNADGAVDTQSAFVIERDEEAELECFVWLCARR